MTRDAPTPLDPLAWAGIAGYLLFVLFMDHQPAWSAQPWYYHAVWVVTILCSAALTVIMLRHAWLHNTGTRLYGLLGAFLLLSALTAYWYYFQVFRPGRNGEPGE